MVTTQAWPTWLMVEPPRSDRVRDRARRNGGLELPWDFMRGDDVLPRMEMVYPKAPGDTCVSLPDTDWGVGLDRPAAALELARRTGWVNR